MDRERAMKPRVLLVEDDPVSRGFFLEVLGRLPVAVDAARDCAQALDAARRHAHALWLVDAHLPDGDAGTLLAALRPCAPAAVALAHTASRSAALGASLRAAGYVEVLPKPIGVDALLDSVGRHLRLPVRDAGPAWDDAAATAALGGAPGHVAALRALFLAELPGAVAAVAAAVARGDAGAARDGLHRLDAACGYAGAWRLRGAVRALHAAPGSGTALRAFGDAAEATLAARPADRD